MTTKLVEFEFDDFRLAPLKQEDMLEVDLSKASMGKIRTDIVYNVNADYVLLPYLSKASIRYATARVPPEKIILDFYIWDEQLKKFWELDKFHEYLGYAKEHGINKCVQMDFSIWYGMPMISANIYKNFKRLHDMAKMGFKYILNFNTFHPKFMELYHNILPETIPTMVIDENHAINKIWMKQDLKTLQGLYSKHNISNVIIQVTRKRIQFLRPVLKMLEENGTKYTIIPSQTMIMALYFNKDRRKKHG